MFSSFLLWIFEEQNLSFSSDFLKIIHKNNIRYSFPFFSLIFEHIYYIHLHVPLISNPNNNQQQRASCLIWIRKSAITLFLGLQYHTLLVHRLDYYTSLFDIQPQVGFSPYFYKFFVVHCRQYYYTAYVGLRCFSPAILHFLKIILLKLF